MQHREAEWIDPASAPPRVAAMAELVDEAGEPGRFFEFADGDLYEVLLDRAGAQPRCRVAASLDLTDTGRLRDSLLSVLTVLTAAGTLVSSLPG